MERCEIKYGQVCGQVCRQVCVQADTWKTQNDKITAWRLEGCTPVQTGAGIDSMGPSPGLHTGLSLRQLF